MVADVAVGSRSLLDEQLKSKISERLRCSMRPALRRLRVTVSGGRVTLGGSVPSYYDKQIALQSCLGDGPLVDDVEVQ